MLLTQVPHLSAARGCCPSTSFQCSEGLLSQYQLSVQRGVVVPVPAFSAARGCCPIPAFSAARGCCPSTSFQCSEGLSQYQLSVQRGVVVLVPAFSAQDPLMMSTQPPCAVTDIDIFVHLENPQHCQPHHCLDTPKYCISLLGQFSKRESGCPGHRAIVKGYIHN